jgi:hypothetical protein
MTFVSRCVVLLKDAHVNRASNGLFLSFSLLNYGNRLKAVKETYYKLLQMPWKRSAYRQRLSKVINSLPPTRLVVYRASVVSL